MSQMKYYNSATTSVEWLWKSNVRKRIMIKYIVPAVFGIAVSVLTPIVGIVGTPVLFVIGVGAVGMLVGAICA